jgi:hypothetical protein
MESEKKTEFICPKCAKVNKRSEKFCFNCGYSFAEEPEKLLDIAQTLKAVQTFGICCVSCVSIFFMIFTIFSFIEWGVQGFLVLAIMVGGIFFMILMIRRLTPNASKIRRFVITDETIEIFVPSKPQFQVNWSDFNTIEINRKIVGDEHFSETFYTFIFIGDSSKSIILESGRDFKKIYKKIIPPLKEIALSKGKTFIGYTKKDKETKEDSWKDTINRE